MNNVSANDSKFSKPLYVYVDIDDTIVRTSGTKRIPMPATIEHVKGLKKAGAILFCWSPGGAAYAQETAREFAIEDCFEAFLPKPNVLLDDQEITSWKRFVSIHPSSCVTKTMADYLKAIEN